MENPKSFVLDPVHDVLHYKSQALDAIFSPQNVAVIGATESVGSVGKTILWNLISNPFGGAVFPVNPKRESVLGIKAYPNIAAVPGKVDLAVIVTPAKTVPGIIRECVNTGVKGAIIISAGFKEIGEEGVELERQILEEAKKGKMRIIGPNCLGVMSTTSGLNATFASTMAQKGKVGFISQSGALCTAVLDWSKTENVGFSAFISIGSMLDVGWGDLIYYLGDDPHTESIVIYMETIGDAQAFLSAAREVALTKPIIVIKPGRTSDAAKAAASHTGSLTGSDEVLDIAFRYSGVLRVNRIGEVFYMAELLAKQPLPKGNRMTILTNAGGPGVLATDELIQHGGKLAEISEESMKRYDELLPAAWSHNNPVDILGDASPERYAKSLEIAADDPNSDGLMVILTPQAMTDPTATAEALKDSMQKLDKPVIASWMGGEEIEEGEMILNNYNIPTFPYPDTSARMFDYMARYSRTLQRLYETPTLQTGGPGGEIDRDKAKNIVDTVRKAGRTILTEFESKELLAAYGIPTGKTIIAENAEDAVKAADEIGYPVVVKIHSETITHKVDVGGVKLNLEDADAVRTAYASIEKSVAEKASPEDFLGVTVQPMIEMDGYELILGSSIDPQFGPVLLFGLGGSLVEIFKDRALALPPLTSTLARRMMEKTKIYTALKGVRGRDPVDLNALEQLLVRFSHLISEQPWIKELDINPLLASPESFLALDARVLLHDPDTPENELPQLAIRPYPIRYVDDWIAKDGTPLIIRPIRAEDEIALREFHRKLSDRTVYMRYLKPIMTSEWIAHDRLARIAHCDYNRELSLIVEIDDEEKELKEIIGLGRLSKVHGHNAARFSILISDHTQGMGLGTELMKRLVSLAKDDKLERIESVMTADNHTMQHICMKLGFTMTPSEDKTMVKAELVLDIDE